VVVVTVTEDITEVGNVVGETDGAVVNVIGVVVIIGGVDGIPVGTLDGCKLGILVGAEDGAVEVGFSVDGEIVVAGVGEFVGKFVGDSVGYSVGESVGDELVIGSCVVVVVVVAVATLYSGSKSWQK
jgi:hypothetical protein